MMKEYTWSEYLESLAPCAGSGWAKESGSDWTDGESFETAKYKMANGDDSYAHMADALLEKISDLAEGVPVREWSPSPIGAYPVVPEFLTGRPDCMRVMSTTGELSPVKIVISTTCSAGLDKETMTRRGVAVLALVMKLQQIRPVELYVLVEGNGGYKGDRNVFQMIKLDTKPLSIAHACFALANVGFARALTYVHLREYHNWDGEWPRDYNSSGRGSYGAMVRRECQMTPEDLWIPSSYLSDSKLINDPVGWVNEQLARYSGGETE